MAEILNSATDRSFVVLDEFGRGTSSREASCLSAAVLEYLSKDTRSLGIFATHLHELYDILGRE